MTRRALLVGAATGGLAGVGNDVETMSELLTDRGFEIRRFVGPDATRAGILAAYEALITDTKAGDAAVFHYAGHGGRARPVAAGEPPPADPAQPDIEFIVPTDFDQSSPTDFRGILAAELSVLLARLIKKSDNVVVILDCCHAAYMSRDPNLRPRALDRLSYIDVDAHLQRQLTQGLDVSQVGPLGNRSAVLLVACAPAQSAYEYVNRFGKTCGIFTESFQIALAEAGSLPVTWATLMRRVRDRVLAVAPDQRPEVEGIESHRLLFETAHVEPTSALPIVGESDGRALIAGGALLGVVPGDEFAVMPAGAAMIDDATAVGTATVDGWTGGGARAAVVLRPGHARIPPGAQAFPTKAAAQRRPVGLRAAAPQDELLRAALAAAPLVRPAEPGDDSVLATVEATADHLVIHDAAGPLTQRMPADAGGVSRVVSDLASLARAATVRALTPDADSVLDGDYTVEWGRVVDGTAIPLDSSGEMVHSGEPVYIRIRNDSAQSVYVTVLDVGISGAISLLTDDSPSGRRLEAGQEYVIGKARFGGLVGLPLGWPKSTPEADARPESIVVLLTPIPQEFSTLQQPAIGERGGAGPAEVGRGSNLQQLLEQMSVGGTRDLTSDPGGPPLRYAARHVDFVLSAVPAPTREVAQFLVDDRPSRSVRLLGGRGAPVSGPGRIAVRLEELIVHRNRALGGADVRVDALVLTGGSRDEPVYRAQTARFSNVRDGDRLPLDNMLVYHGSAVDFLDFAWWVARDRKDSLDLNDLLKEQLTGHDFTAAATQLAGLAIAAPEAVAAVAAVGAAAVVVNTAYTLLSRAVGDSIGLYRTSFLTDEDFGAGRHPVSGLLRAQDFSFSYRIERVV